MLNYIFFGSKRNVKIASRVKYDFSENQKKLTRLIFFPFILLKVAINQKLISRKIRK